MENDDDEKARPQPLGYRDKEYVENKLAAAQSEALNAVVRLRGRGFTAEADFLMEATKTFGDACRAVRKSV